MSEYRYGRKSKSHLKTLHPWLQLILIKTLSRHDHSIDDGGRTDDQQQALFDAVPQRSKVEPPEGNHLFRDDETGIISIPCAFAADVTPWINGRRLATRGDSFGPAQQAQFAYFLGILESIAREVLAGTGYKLRLGINWDMDAEILTDQDFQDFFHVELVRA